MPAAKKGKSLRPAAESQLAGTPAQVAQSDRIVLEIRKFIASAIFFNAQAAEQVGLG